MTSRNVIKLTASNFHDQVLDCDETILVHFSSQEDSLQPMLDRIADRYVRTIRIGRINIHDFPQIAQEYRVRTAPTCIIFQHKQQVALYDPRHLGLGQLSNILTIWFHNFDLGEARDFVG